MPAADAHAQNPQYLVAGDQSAARELQGVLSLYLPAFYRRALRVLGNRVASEDASRRRCWLPTNICTNSGGSRRCPLG